MRSISEIALAATPNRQQKKCRNIMQRFFVFSAALLVRRFKCLRAPLFAALFVGSGVRKRKQGERLRGPENVVAGNMEELHFSFEVCFFFSFFSWLSPDPVSSFFVFSKFYAKRRSGMQSIQRLAIAAVPHTLPKRNRTRKRIKPYRTSNVARLNCNHQMRFDGKKPWRPTLQHSASSKKNNPQKTSRGLGFAA